MNDFKKAKIAFALALLGTLFTLHPVVENPAYQEASAFTTYLGYQVNVVHAYLVLAGLLALTVYFYAVGFMTERVSTWVEKLGNVVYALAIMVVPVYGVLYLSSFLAETLGALHLYWIVPLVALGLGVLVGGAFVVRLGQRDHSAKQAHWADLEISSLYRARALFEGGHYDLSVMETWKAIDARLRRVFAERGIRPPANNPKAMIDKALKTRILQESSRAKLNELRHHWSVAMSHQPLTQEDAEAALNIARDILSLIPLKQHGATFSHHEDASAKRATAEPAAVPHLATPA
jgi:HEPN domain-containing protein